MAAKGSEVQVKGKGARAVERRAVPSILGLRQEIDRLFEDFFQGNWLTPGFVDFDPFKRLETGLGALTPSVDVSESDKAYSIAAELPGMDEHDIEVALSDGVLTIKGEKKEESEEKEKDYHLTERRYGSFRRSFAVPDVVEAERITASFENGVLKIVMPKSAKATTAIKRIRVKKK